MHEELRSFGSGLWVFESRAENGMGRKMTVMALPDGRLAVHSAIDLDEPGRLDALGPVAWILLPNALHTVEAPVLAQRYPSARVLAARGVAAKLSGKLQVHGFLEEWPAELAPHVACLPLGGTRMPEAAFVHRASRTLVLSDLAFHFRPEDFTGGMGRFMALNQALGPLGPTRVFRWLMCRDDAALGASLRQLLELDFDRVVMAHGHILESGGKEAMRAGFARWLGAGPG